jgi:DNA polymerase-4
MERNIIHLNVADFAVAVERRIAPRLRQRPMIIAPDGTGRATVFDMSEEAYQAGIRKGMALKQARRLCRDAVILPPRPERYEQAMADLFKRTLPYSPLVEPGDGDGHLFVDVTGTSRLFGPCVDVAWRLQRQIKSELGLDPIWSVAPNKLVAKVATRLVKPTGEYIVGAGEEELFLSPLPVWLIPGVETADWLRLKDFNLTRVFQVTALTVEQLQVPFGQRAEHLYNLLKGMDMSPVQPAGQTPPKVHLCHEFGTDTNDPAQLESALYTLTEKAGQHLRVRQKSARRITVRITYTDGPRYGRSLKLIPATANDFTLFDNARKALYRAWLRRTRIRHLALTCDRLIFPPIQLPLFPSLHRQVLRQDHLVTTLDTIRQRFGSHAVQMGRCLAA